MTTHLCRDFVTLPSASSPGTSMYLLAIFVHHVLSYDVETNVNFDLTSSTYTKARYNADPENLKFGSINLVTGSEYSVILPSGSYDVSLADVDRILALRSQNFPKHNSGLFRITSVNVASNSLGIDYRSSEFPPSESGSLAWRIFESEVAVPTWRSGSNGVVGGYNTRGTATASRIMLNSPIGFHLRLCLESIPDRSGTIPGGFSIAPGAGSVAFADYDDVEGHLHGPMWFNTTSSLYRGTAVGLSPRVNNFEWTTGQWRFYAIGDDVRSTTLAFTRNVTFPSGGNGWAAFGLPEDEIEPLPRKIIDRVFVVGYANALPNLSWHSGFFNDGHAQGMAWSRYGGPVPCVVSSYSDMRNASPHVRNFTSSIDTPYLGATELIDVELVAGTVHSNESAAAAPLFGFLPRRVGRMPMLRQGRANYTQWALSPDKKWLHTMDGIFVPWSGPHLSGTITGSNVVVLTSASYINGEGIEFFETDPPMSDPPLPPPDPGANKDAVRFRKTYSFFRQPSVDVKIAKGGSNPPKP